MNSFFIEIRKFATLSALWFCFPLSAQTDDFIYLNQAVTVIMDQAEQKVPSDFGFYNGCCVWGAYLDKSETVRWAQEFSSSATYILLAGGDEDATDVDLYIEDPSGAKVFEDKSTNRSSYIKFTPTKTQKYTITLKLYGANSSGSFCAMTLLQRYSNSILVSELQNATLKLAVLYALVEKVKDVRFHDADNQWCLFGTLLLPDNELSITNISLGSLEHVIIAAGDTHTDDIGLCLLNNDTNVKIKCDEESWDHPIGLIEYTTSGSRQYKLALRNERTATAKALVLCAILTK